MSTNISPSNDRGLFEALIGDGRPLLLILSFGLFLSGLAALFLAATGHFLPHDEEFLGMTAKELCAVHGCRIVHFMIHDRASFGGTLVAIGLAYFWLVEFPLRDGREWAWWILVISGIVGFASFLAYLGFGYLDTWHAVATLALVPCFIGGLCRARTRLSRQQGIRSLFEPSVSEPLTSWFGLGRGLLLVTTLGITGAGLTILCVGMTSVFVPQDLAFMKVSTEELNALNPRLIPLIAHDRAGFGGGLSSCGLALFFSIWCGQPSRSLWQMLCLAGLVGFGAAVGVHPAVGYTDAVHIAPAVLGAVAYLLGLVLTFKSMMREERNRSK